MLFPVVLVNGSGRGNGGSLVRDVCPICCLEQVGSSTHGVNCEKVMCRVTEPSHEHVDHQTRGSYSLVELHVIEENVQILMVVLHALNELLRRLARRACDANGGQERPSGRRGRDSEERVQFVLRSVHGGGRSIGILWLVDLDSTIYASVGRGSSWPNVPSAKTGPW